MKKIFTLIAAAAMLAVSCQKEIAPESDDNASATGKLTATIVKTSTKVTYSETPELNLQPAWEVGDKIIGFDDAGNTYTLAVASVSAETATLSGILPDGTYHLIYKSGAQASDISSKSLAIDYAAQKGDKTMPAVMLADGTVENGSCEFAFTNAGAIIGISAVKGVPSGATISKITIEGESLSAATVELDGSTLVLNAATATGDAISTATLSGITTTDANGTLSSPVFIAVPAGAKIAKVLAIVVREQLTGKIPSLAPEKEGIDYVTIAGKKWAKWNVGANSQSDYGWYFAWAGTEGYVPTEISIPDCKWVSASGVDKYTYPLSSTKMANASDYLYINIQTFIGHCFDWASTPYQTQNANYYTKTKFTKYLGNGALSSKYKDPSAIDADALKTVLDPEDDAARVNWGGTWRMPTSAEFKAMKDATYWAWDSADMGYYVFDPDATHTAGTRVSSIPEDLSKSSALLFFPSGGVGYNAFLGDVGSKGYYRSSTLHETYPYYAYMFFLTSDKVDPNGNYDRYEGLAVRPVSD